MEIGIVVMEIPVGLRHCCSLPGLTSKYGAKQGDVIAIGKPVCADFTLGRAEDE